MIASRVDPATQIRRSREEMNENTRAMRASTYPQFREGKRGLFESRVEL